MKQIPLAIAVLVSLNVSEPLAQSRNHDSQIFVLNGAQRLAIQTRSSAKTFTNNAFTTVTTLNGITIPDGQTGLLVASFTGESSCNGPAGSWCAVRIVCDGNELAPSQGSDFAFTSARGETYVSATMTRRSALLTGGDHSCSVETAAVNGATKHRLDDWTFMVKFWRQ